MNKKLSKNQENQTKKYEIQILESLYILYSNIEQTEYVKNMVAAIENRLNELR